MASIPASDQLNYRLGGYKQRMALKAGFGLYSNTAPTTNIFGYTPWYLQVGNEWREVKVARVARAR
jgi:hypothetical protein